MAGKSEAAAAPRLTRGSEMRLHNPGAGYRREKGGSASPGSSVGGAGAHVSAEMWLKLHIRSAVCSGRRRSGGGGRVLPAKRRRQSNTSRSLSSPRPNGAEQTRFYPSAALSEKERANTDLRVNTTDVWRGAPQQTSCLLPPLVTLGGARSGAFCPQGRQDSPARTPTFPTPPRRPATRRRGDNAKTDDFPKCFPGFSSQRGND